MKIGANDLCWCGSGKKYKKCHMTQDGRIALFRERQIEVPDPELLKTPEQIEKMKESAKINMACLDAVAAMIGPGISTEEIDALVSQVTRDMGGIPAPLNYEGFPKSVCTSINEQVCHGIPSPKEVLKDGDIINVDVSTILDGYFSDSSRMYLIGEVSEDKRRLVEVTRESLQIGLAQVKPYGRLGDVGAAINEFAIQNGYSVVREIGGHGIGLQFHEDPWVSFVSKWNTGMLLVPGLTFTIEPMINMGKADIYIDDANGWTVYTRDGKPSAQWEIMVTVTEEGYEVLCW